MPNRVKPKPKGPCFNPHPPLRADAIFRYDMRADGFQYVSILTRPYGRMLFALAKAHARAELVSILTRPYGRMLWQRPAWGLPSPVVSILTRPYGRML